MGFRHRLRFRRDGEAGAAFPLRQDAPIAPVLQAASRRQSNGLKDFLQHLGDAPLGRILDLGPAWQSTVSFFTERGFRLTTEDLLRAWMECRESAENKQASHPENGDAADPAALAATFLETNLILPPGTFDGILGWDLFDHLECELRARLAARLHDLLKPGGALLAIFHGGPSYRFHRYRVLDSQTVELLPAPASSRVKRAFQNREILTLFGSFRSSRIFVGRDQLREGLFTK